MYRLTFLLPPSLHLRATPGRHTPCLHGCLLAVHATGLVEITGPSRERVFEQATRFMRVTAKGAPAQSIAAVLQTPSSNMPAGRDGWSIILGAQIAFSPTSLPAVIPDEPDPPARALPSVLTR